jgi:hypothetical protein
VLDVRDAADETIAQAKKEVNAGNYRGGLALVLPLLRISQEEALTAAGVRCCEVRE